MKLALSFLIAACSVVAALGDEPMPYGVVDFKTSCQESVTADFNTAVSMLYSFWYDESFSSFNNIFSRDPSCCMALWGASMTFSHPIWDFMEDDRLAAASKYANRATECAANNNITTREKGYIHSLAVYMNTTDPSLAPATRLQMFADAVKEEVYRPFDAIDENAGVIYGLAVLGVGFYSETEPAEGFPSLTLAGLTEELVVLRNPNSPGGLHYVIHAYDQPGHAYRALPAAYRYGNVSYEVPHALHMPSHIFSDQGLWDDEMMANVNSMNSAYASDGNMIGGGWFHPSYFLQFGLLQRVMDCDALGMVTELQQIALSSPQALDPESAVRIPTMYLVETRDWASAAKFSLSAQYPTIPASLWEENPWTLVTANFVVAAARAILDYPAASISAAVAEVVAANRTLCSDPAWAIHQLPYWRQSFDVMTLSAQAWETFRATSMDAGIAAMQAVQALQLASWAPEVAHAWDASEQLAEMYVLRGGEGDAASALAAYEQAIAVYPNRYHSLAGAGRCADLLGDDIKASQYYGQLITLAAAPYPEISLSGVPAPECPPYTPTRRPGLAAAEAYFARK